MNVNLGIWDKLTKLVIFLLGVAGLIGLFYWYLPLIQENQRYRRAIIDTEAKTIAEERYARQLKSAQDSLNDPRTIERLAREKLGLARTNEMVVRFETPARR
jgi:cell division protein FtsB